MIIFPAIDIKDGKVVRLLQGKFDAVTEYGKDPLKAAHYWMDQGAQWLHVVDLDGAQKGKICNFKDIAGIAKSVDIPVQMGGGVRSEEDIHRLLEAGIKRVVLGTRVIADRNFLNRILSRWPQDIAVSLDCSDGMVAQRGWADITNVKGENFARELEQAGLQYLIYTDIQRDGMMSGPNLDGLKNLLEAVDISVIASGGISGLDDIRALKELNNRRLIGAITGRAIYEGTLDLKKAITLCSRNE